MTVALVETLIGLAVLLFFYMLPFIVAAARRHNNSIAIFIFNFLLGWTFLGWVGALVWSCTDNVRLK